MARKTSGSSCGRTGSQIGSSNPSTIASITAATLGTPSLINLGKSCPSRAATGQPWVTQCEDWYYPSEIAPCNTEAATAMDEIRRLISQFENAVRQYDSCQPHATDKWRADLVRHRKWDLQIIAEL